VAIKRYITEEYHVRMKDAQAAEQRCSEKALIIMSFFKRSKKNNCVALINDYAIA
jgi:hypothetical protein